ncbi:putative trehalose-phosphatase [Medicago truncatula]|uniref:Trehalose 6-phosphate phosphatase n=1 Tax=Medicago truncatula TaxID=3880 RepID=G7J6S8_MEDTR|nr:probable trehalose-phosphate phosphatase 2 isoform X2 [Medicago truncatula]AES72460.1 trehalose-6-phosphate phosphatase [Medicago truncatula]RHN69601.1 putative trehalose-phosphatase [Medicago truncatula]
MKHMIFLLVTFKIIKKKLTKLRESMGFQTAHNTKLISQPDLKAKEDSCDGLIPRPLNFTQFTPSGYDSWLVKHPSALSSFDRLMKAAIGKRIVVFLDYDGTLSPIVNDPDRAFMSDEMRAAVSEVATYFPTAIISGRSREKVKDFVKLNNLYYAGSHGMDIMAPSGPIRSSDGNHQCYNNTLDTNGNEVPFQPAKKFLPAIQEILRKLENVIKDIEGAKIENNRFCISVHFRQVHEKDYNKLEEKVKSVLGKNPLFCLTEGKKVMEIRPSIEWNKGNAVEYFLDTLGLSSSSNFLPVYIGDDKTDEDAFKVIKRMGQGYPIIVSSTPRETDALYSLRDPSEVLIFLSRLAKWTKTYYSRRPLNIGN